MKDHFICWECKEPTKVKYGLKNLNIAPRCPRCYLKRLQNIRLKIDNTIKSLIEERPELKELLILDRVICNNGR